METNDQSLVVYYNLSKHKGNDGSKETYDNVTSSMKYNMYEDFKLSNDMLPLNDNPFSIFLIVLYVSAFVVGFVGNIFVILVVLRHRHMRTLTNVFFFNLTIGDFMVNCICIPTTLYYYVYRDWIFGELMCRVTSFLQSTAVSVSVLSMLSISVNRYFAIHIPLRAKILFSRARVHLMLVFIWVVSLGAFSPMIYIYRVTVYGVPEVYTARVCLAVWVNLVVKHIYNMIIFLLLFVFPLTAMSVLYMKISLALWSKNRQLFNHARKQAFMSPQVDRLLLQRRQTVRTLVLLVVLFACSWLPFYVVDFWIEFNPNSSYVTVVNEFVHPLAQLLGLSNSSINPILYCFLSNGFRRALLNLCCRRSKRSGIGMVMTVRYRCSDDSGVGSVETVLS